jgi:multidrug resistance efflux pump
LIVLCMFTLARMFYTPGGRLNFVIMVTVLLMIACFTWIFYTWLIYQMSISAKDNQGYCK